MYSRAIDSLAKLECPDFSEQDEAKTLFGFYEMFWHPEIYEWFVQEVISQSDGKISFDHRSSQELHIPMIQGEAKYFVLSDGQKKKAVSFSPAANPFRFYDLKG